MDILILYSEYSKRCKNFMQKLDSTTVLDTRKFYRLCIDNPTVRQLVIDYPIQKVPCVCVKTGDSLAHVDIYEGKQSFDWLESFIDQIYTQIQQQQEKEMNDRIEREAEMLAKKKLLLEEQRRESESKNPPGPTATNVKSKAKLIAQNRAGDMTFNPQQQQDMGEMHVSQVQTKAESTESTSGSVSINDIVKQMENERNMDEDEIRRKMPPGS